MTYNGLFFDSSNILPIYSPMTPIISICEPDSIIRSAMTAVMPETKYAVKNLKYKITAKVIAPNDITTNPKYVSNFNGLSENENIVSFASLIIFLKGYFRSEKPVNGQYADDLSPERYGHPDK